MAITTPSRRWVFFPGGAAGGSPPEMLRQRHKSHTGHVGPSNRTNFGSAENPAVSTEVVAVEPQVLQLNRSYFG